MHLIQKLYGIIVKNIRLLLRSKSSSLIVILGPLLLVLLVGAAFNTATVYGIKVSVYSESYNDLTNELVSKIQETKFNVIKADSKESCINTVKEGDSHVCLIFPANLNIQAKNQITFYVDPSRVNLVYILMDKISAQVQIKAEEISLQLTKNILDKLAETNKEIDDKRLLATTVASSLKTADKQTLDTLNAFKSIDMNKNFDDLGWSLLEAQFDGNTSSLFQALYGELKVKVRDFADTLNQARVARDTSVRNLNAIRSTTSESSLLVESLGESLDLIGKNINAIDVTNPDRIVDPLEIKIEPITTSKSNLSFLFPTLLVLLVMFIGLLLSSSVVIRERRGAAYFRNFLTPTNDTLFIIGHFLTNFFIISLQMLIILSVSFYFFKEALLNVLINLIGALSLVIAMFVLLGMFVGYIFKSEETGALASISLGSIFLFLSNTVLPLEYLPSFMTKIGQYNPFVLSESLIRKITLFDATLQTQWQTTAILGGVIVGLFILIHVVKRGTKIWL